MTWQDALDIVVTRTGVERYRWLCSDENPVAGGKFGRNTYRRWVVERATPKPATPIQVVGNAAAAAGRVVVAAIHGDPLTVTPEVLAERRAICAPCEHLKGGKCVLCGCPYERKIRRTTEACPVGKWPRIIPEKPS